MKKKPILSFEQAMKQMAKAQKLQEAKKSIAKQEKKKPDWQSTKKTLGKEGAGPSVKSQEHIIPNGNITILGTKTYSFSKYNTNEYYSASDVNFQNPLEPNQLSSIQRGHIYNIVFRDDEYAEVSGIRMCDSETGGLIHALKTKNTLAPPAKWEKSPQFHTVYSFDFGFLLSVGDVERFTERVKAINGMVKMDIPTIDQVRMILAEVDELGTAYFTVYESLRSYVESNEFCLRVEGTGLKDISEQVETLRTYRSHLFDAGHTLGQIRDKAKIYSEEVVRLAADIACTKTQSVIKAVHACNPETLLNSALAATSTEGGENDYVGSVDHLTKEVQRLREIFPVFENIAVDDDGSLLIAIYPEGRECVELRLSFDGSGYTIKLEEDLLRTIYTSGSEQEYDSRFSGLDLD